MKAAVADAVAAHAEAIRAEIEAQVEEQQAAVKAQQLGKAAGEGTRLHMDPGAGYEFAMIPLDRVDFNPLSLRKEDELTADAPGIPELAQEIQQRGGLLRPLLVYRKDDRYMLVKGARRLVALRSLGEEIVHAYILPAKPPIGMEGSWVNGY